MSNKRLLGRADTISYGGSPVQTSYTPPRNPFHGGLTAVSQKPHYLAAVRHETHFVATIYMVVLTGGLNDPYPFRGCRKGLEAIL